MDRNITILRLLIELYGETTGRTVFRRLRRRLRRHLARRPRYRSAAALTENETILITYADQVQAPPQPPLAVLEEFCCKHLSGLISGIHILPFYPWTSDDGFAVKDYRAVAAEYGGWPAIARLKRRFRLMFDAVVNHVSAQHPWFRGFIRGVPRFQQHFIVVTGQPDLSQVARPRAQPLLTEFATAGVTQAVWTTFGSDQIDLNYANPEVLLAMTDTLLFYAARGADFIRLDAIAYLWKEIGTPCLHHPHTHRIVRFWRAVLDEVEPQVKLITETNVPHAENLSYFGEGGDEAQLIYNFALPPLVLHTLRTGNCHALANWAASLKLPAGDVAFFNFLASHDGIGLKPIRGLLPPEDIEALVRQTLAHGGRVSYHHNPDGSQSPYELNINYFDALNHPHSGEPPELQTARFLAAQAIMLALAGVPGIYFHSLFGSRGWPEGAQATGRNRTINRQKCARAELERELARPGSLRRLVFTGYKRLLRARAASRAFHPQGRQEMLDYGEAVFALLRRAPHASGEQVLCLQNVSARPQIIIADLEVILGLATSGHNAIDLLSGQIFRRKPTTLLRLQAYQTLWLTSGEKGRRSAKRLPAQRQRGQQRRT